ncbi:MAG: F0F1 ATP synthase subunit A [Chitinophagales bacterium]|nr:F0F1 ATP synthase subunit A [Chitinophagales bacterium]
MDLYRRFLCLGLFIVMSFSLFASESSNNSVHGHTEATSKADYAAQSHEAKGHEVIHQATSDKFDPVPIIMHHIADANEFHIAGDLVLPLPVIIYNKTNRNFFTAISSEFHAHHGEGTVAVKGYEMKHSRVVNSMGDDIIDFSITKNVFVLLLSAFILSIVMFTVKSKYQTNQGAPKGIQSLLEPFVNFVHNDIAKENIGVNYQKYTVLLVCIFFFILINNLLGLIPIFPGSANVSGNISFTLGLGIIVFLMINLTAKKDYWMHIFAMPGVPKPLYLILTPIELAGVFIKPIALVLRLFGNITGGHIAILSIASMVFIMGEAGKNALGALAGGAIAVPLLLFVNGMELFVAFVQAYVFTLLSAIFIGIAQEEHHHDHH